MDGEQAREVSGQQSTQLGCPIRERNLAFVRPIPYAEGVTAGSPGLQREASYPGFGVTFFLALR